MFWIKFLKMENSGIKVFPTEGELYESFVAPPSSWGVGGWGRLIKVKL